MFAFLLLAAAAPATAPPASDGIATLGADAETRWVPFDLTPGNQIRFAMTLDGKPIVAVLDTGVSYSVLAAQSAVTDPARVTKGGTATAIGGKVGIGWMQTAELAIGGLIRRGGRVAVAPLPAAATGSADAVDMLVGRDVTGGQAIDIDYAARRFRLLPSGRMPFVGKVAPLSISARRQIYESAITLAGRRLAPIVVDTGDGGAVTLSAASWRATAPHDAPTTTTISYGLAGSTISTLTIVPTLTIGDLVARETELRVENAGGFSDGIGVAGRIGSGFLQHYRVLLDPVAGRMILQAGPAADRRPLRSTSGLLVRVDPDRLEVLHVMRGSPAAETGWRASDRICAIDGSPITAAYTGSPLAAWSIGTPGRIVALQLCEGSVRTLTLKHFY